MTPSSIVSDSNSPFPTPSNALLQNAVLEALAEGVTIHDAAGVILMANPSAQRILRLSLEQLLGRDSFDSRWRAIAEDGSELQPKDHPPQTVIRTGQPVSNQVLGVHRGDGTLVWVSANAVPLRDSSSQQITGAICSFFDVTEQRRSKVALRDSESRLAQQSRLFEGIASTTPDFIYVFDLDGRFLYANRRLLEVWGRTYEQAVGRNLYELGYPQWHADMHMEELRRVIETGQPIKGEVPFTGGSGISGVYEYIFTPVFGPDGQVEVIAGTTRDVTERRQAEGRARTILESITDAFFSLDVDWRFTYINPQAQRVLGRTPADLTGRLIWDEYPDLIGSKFERAYRRAGDQGIASSATAFFAPHDRWYEVHAYPSQDGGISVYFRDVTERQRWVETVAETRRKLDAALIAGEVGTFEWDVVRDQLWGDANFERIFGISLDASGAAPLSTYVAAIHPADRERTLRRVSQSLETGVDYEAEYRVTSTIPPRWVIARGKVQRDEAGRAVRFPGVVVDQTERKQAELLLTAQNRALELITTGAPLVAALSVLTSAVEDQYDGTAVAAILLLDDDGCTLRTAAAPSLPAEYIAAIDGIKAKPGLGTCAAAAGRNEPVVTPDIEAAESWEGLSQLPLQLGLKAAWSMPIRAADGRVLGTFGTYFRERREPTDRERRIVESLCQAAALAVERRRADEALRESEARFRQLADAMPQMVWVTRPDGYHEYYNKRWYDFTGMPDGSTDGEGWNDVFHPDDQGRAWAAWRHSLSSGEPYEIEYRLRHRSGEYRWTLGRALPIRDADGAITRWFGTCTDIDGIKRMQQEREHLLDSERSARGEAERASRLKDEFLATVSHELRTPLNAILGYAQVLRHGQVDEDTAEGLEVIERNARAQTQIIEDLLDMSRMISGKLRLDVQLVDLPHVIDAALETVTPAANAKGIRLVRTVDPLAGPVSGDPSRLQQVVWNLVTNAVKFTPKGGRVQVVLARVNSHVEIVVSDTGQGIRSDFLPHVFDKFRQSDSSASRRHGGLGLGLSLVKSLVELHGGRVRVASLGEGRGATFTVELPLTAMHADPPDTKRRHPTANSANNLPCSEGPSLEKMTVLVVDDERDSRELVRRLLEECGAAVITAGSATEALDTLGRLRVDVLLSDIGMPDIDGYELLRRVRALPAELGGGVPAAALTAFARSEDRTRALLAGFQTHITKPVEPLELAAAVASLGRRSSSHNTRSSE